jgi:hypothetical protein
LKPIALAAGLLACAPPPLLAQRIEVGRNVQVSTAHPRAAHYEVIAAGDPRDAARMVVGSFIFPDGGTTGGTIVYTTRDAGKSWTPTLQGAVLDNTSDPAPAFGPEGNVYYTAASLGPAGTPREKRTMLMFRSRDGGLHWQPLPAFTYSDRQYVVVDATGGPYHGRIYVNGNNRVPYGTADFVVFTSSDQGASFSGPHTRAGFGQNTAGVMGNAVVASDGTLIGIFEDRDGLRAITSTNGGQSLHPATVLDTAFVPAGNRKGGHNNVTALPIVAIDPGAGRYRDRVYAVWADRRTGQSRIFFAYSADKGATWSASRPIDDRPADDRNDHFMPVVAVNPQGVVGVMWYDRRDHADNLGWDARFTASLNGGETFLPSVKVSEQGTTFGSNTQVTPLRASVSRVKPQDGSGLKLNVSLNNFAYLGGDTNGLVAAADGLFHPVWVDNRTGVPQVWTAAVKVHPAAPISGKDVSGQVMLRVEQNRYDRATETLTAVVRLQNTSQQTLRGPFRVQIADATSALGRLQSPSEPLVFDVATLAPGATSAPVTWRFRISDVKPARTGNRYLLNLLDLHVLITGVN